MYKKGLLKINPYRWDRNTKLEIGKIIAMGVDVDHVDGYKLYVDSSKNDEIYRLYLTLGEFKQFLFWLLVQAENAVEGEDLEYRTIVPKDILQKRKEDA